MARDKDIKENPERVGNGEDRPEPKAKNEFLDYIQNEGLYRGWS